MISYQIYSFDEISGSIAVLFKKNDITIASYNVDIPLTDDGLFITGEELNSYLLAMFPQHIIDRQNKLEIGVPNATDIQNLVVPLEKNEPTEEENTERQMWLAFEEEKRIAAILVKFGVLETDPTKIPTDTL
jgi:hypothetical protein